MRADRATRGEWRRDDRPARSRTRSRSSIAIGNPADGVFAAQAMRGTGGWSAAVSDERIVAGDPAARGDTGVFTETAGGATVAGALALAEQGRFRDG